MQNLSFNTTNSIFLDFDLEFQQGDKTVIGDIIRMVDILPENGVFLCVLSKKKVSK